MLPQLAAAWERAASVLDEKVYLKEQRWHQEGLAQAQQRETKPLNMCNAVNEALHQALDNDDK